MLARTAIDLGLIIRERRRKLGLDQRELAARNGASRQWVIEIEKGKPRAEIGLLLLALEALGLGLFVEDRARPLAVDEASQNLASWNIDIDAVIEKAREVTR